MADGSLTSNALSAFFSVVNNQTTDDQQTVQTYQAEVVKFDQNGLAWCKIKDSDVSMTPVEVMTATVKVGDIIDITIENGIATGKPSAMSQIVTMDYANALFTALAGDSSLLEQYSSHGMFQDITAQRASFGELDAQNANIENAYIETAKINKAIVESLQATTGMFKQLQSNDLAVKRFSAQQVTAAKAFITSLIASNAIIESLQARNATIIDLLVSQANIDKLVAGEATVESIVAGSIDAEYVRADRANINEAWVKELMSMSAWFTSDVTVTGDQSITGQLKSVLIDGDTARFRNIYADALKILGEDGLYHRLNFMNYDDKTYNYVLAEILDYDNPSEMGWYELVDGNYVLSEDTEINYIPVQESHEIDSSQVYTITIDYDGFLEDYIITLYYGDEDYVFDLDGVFKSYEYDYVHDETTSTLNLTFDGTRTFTAELTSGDVETLTFSYGKPKDYYVRTTLVDQGAQDLIDKYGDNLNDALHGSHIIAETVTATQLDASSVRAALLEAAEIQIGSYATPHIRMYEGNLGFYPGSTMTFSMIPKYELAVPDSGETPVPSDEGWYELVDDEYVLSEDTVYDSSKTYYKLTADYLHGSPRSRRWYELDPDTGYFRTVDYEPDPSKTYYDGVEASVAYVTNQELYIPRAVVTDKMAVGTPENGEWVWEVSDNQNLSLTWGGRYGGVS